MQVTALDRWLVAGVILPLLYIGHEVTAYGACAEDKCIPVVTYMVRSNNVDSCYNLKYSSCSPCMGPKFWCVDPGPTQPYCINDPTRAQEVTTASNCTALCTLVNGGNAEASLGNLQTTTKVGNPKICSSVAEGGGGGGK